MREIRKQVRELTDRYEERLGFLNKQYSEELAALQTKCPHASITRWKYEIDTYGEIASTAEGILIKYRECMDCGLIESKIDDTNDYDSEVLF